MHARRMAIVSGTPTAHAFRLLLHCLCLVCLSVPGRGQTAADTAREILNLSGVSGGFVVHAGCGDGRLTCALRANESLMVHGLDPDPGNVREARDTAFAQGLYGDVSVEHWNGESLPYVDGMVNLLVWDLADDVPSEEVERILTPGGVACIRQGDGWRRVEKAWPTDIDDWTHYLHDATNNPVAKDFVVGPPQHLQWVGSPRWSRHHDRMASMSSLVSTAGRIFYIADEGSRLSIQLPARWKLVARDAFNGTVLWKRDIPTWHTRIWPLKSGPAQLTRRLVTSRDHVFVTLGLRAPVSALHPRSGKTLRVYGETDAAEEFIHTNGVLFVLTDPGPKNRKPFVPDRSETWGDTRRVARKKPWTWDERPRRVVAVNAGSGSVLWSVESRVVPMTLAADDRRTYFHDGEAIVALDRGSGKRLWRSGPISRRRVIAANFGPNLIAYQDVVLFSGGDRSMCSLDATTGKTLWDARHPRSGHSSQEDLMVAGGLVWSAATAATKDPGVFTGLDPRSGEVKKEFAPDVETYWFHHRCHRSKATERFLLPSRTGVEFVDFREQTWQIHHWFRGGCIYGVMPCNGLIYAPPHACACYLESKLYGFNVLAPQSPTREIPETIPDAGRLERGPAYGSSPARAGVTSTASDWPTYRHDPRRSGTTATEVMPRLTPRWDHRVGGRLSSPVVAAGQLLVAGIDVHTAYSLDADTGTERWRFTAGARIDSPPSVHRGLVVFGCADGWVYCLRATDGELVWRFRAAPLDRRIMAFEQLESPWPVHGSVLVQPDPSANGEMVVTCIAGRSMFVDGGLRLVRLALRTGQKLSETVLDEQDPGEDGSIQNKIRVLNMPVALPDVLSSDGGSLYMRSQQLELDGTRKVATPLPTDPAKLAKMQKGDDQHLFSPVGFLDGAWFHRAYWLYGRRFSSGCNWWANAGRFAPSGRILVFDDDHAYGYGRKPEYYQWSVPLEYHIFATDRDPSLTKIPQAKDSEVAVAKSASLDPTGKPLAVMAWVRPLDGNGVVLARGGASHGYALALQDGSPMFLVRVKNKLHSVIGVPIEIGRWTHVAGVLTPDKQLLLYVDGDVSAQKTLPGFIAADPNEAMQIGTDRGSEVGDYTEPAFFRGEIDDVRLYFRAMTPEAIRLQAGAQQPSDDMEGLALYYTFDDGRAPDLSGNSNHGGVGASSTQGRFGKGMAFTASANPKRATPGPRALARQFSHTWSKDSPIFGRAMVLAGRNLFVAGPPDILNEEESYQRFHEPEMQKQLEEQEKAWVGRKGAVLLTYSARTGTALSRRTLGAPPVWDGMVAAGGRLYMCLTDGRVVCYDGTPERQ